MAVFRPESGIIARGLSRPSELNPDGLVRFGVLTHVGTTQRDCCVQQGLERAHTGESTRRLLGDGMGNRRQTKRTLVGLGAALFLASAVAPQVHAQSSLGMDPADATVSGYGTPMGLLDDAEVARRMASHQARGKQFVMELRKLRATYFRNVRNTEIRQAGIDRLKEYTDPASFEILLDVFKFDGVDVRAAIVDHLADLKTDEALATLAWTAVHEEDEEVASLAADRLNSVTARLAIVPRSVQSVIAEGLKSRESDVQGDAAKLAADMRLYEAIPMMVNAQLNPGNTGGGSGGGTGTGALAQIFIGQQVAYVSGLDPVVGESAVGFDPELSVATDGVYLRVSGVAVTFYNVDVHNALRQITNAGWGPDSTRELGWNIPAWHEWTQREYEPRIAALVKGELDRRAAVAGGVSATEVPGSREVVPAQTVPAIITPDLDTPVPPGMSGPGGG